MKIWATVSADIRKFGGFMRGGNTTLDGIEYMFKAEFDDSDQIEAFRHEFGNMISKSATDFVNGILTLWFSVKQ